MRTMKWLPILSCIALNSCASIGITFERANQEASLTKKNKGDAIDQGAGIDFDISYNKIGIIDTSGGLMAAATNATSKEVARREAMKDAAERGAKPGETVHYKYNVQPPVPGIATKLSFVFGGESSGAKYKDSLVEDSNASTKNEISGFIFEWGFGSFEFSKMQAEIGIRLDYLNYKISNLPDGAAFNSFDDSVIAMPFLLDLSYSVHYLVRIGGRIGYDPIFGIMNAIASEDFPANNVPLGLFVEGTPMVANLSLTAMWRKDQVNFKNQAMDRSEMLFGAKYQF